MEGQGLVFFKYIKIAEEVYVKDRLILKNMFRQVHGVYWSLAFVFLNK